MFATVSHYSSYLSLQLLLTLLLLDHGYAQNDIGDWCSSPRGPGWCRLIHECPSAYRDFELAKLVNCGFQSSTPIVCCASKYAPSIPITTSRPSQSEWNRQLANPAAGGGISSRMCAEYQQRVNIALRLDSRISGGSESNILEFPHMAAIGYKAESSISWDCGGTLISERFVLTAAHCLKSPRWGWGEAQWVRLGSSAQDKRNSATQILGIVERIKYSEFRRSVKYGDIALLKLEKSVTFNANVLPACLNTENNLPAGKIVVATGWGFTNDDANSRSLNLLKVELPIVARATCAQFYDEGPKSKRVTSLPRGIDDQRQICAGGNGKNTCQGDSGGPIFLKTAANSGNARSLAVVAGVTSFGRACTNNAPGVYTRVSFYLPWIESIVWSNE